MAEALARRTYLFLPTYDGTRRNAMALLHCKGVVMDEVTVSLLAWNFNSGWAHALNMRQRGEIDAFCMLHADIQPLEMKWMEWLREEMLANQAQVMSAVVPIKNDQGLTSTAIDTDDPWFPRRLTMHEIMHRPVTWTHPRLLVNTGMLMVDFREPWVEQVRFTIQDRIVKDAKGQWEAQVLPEDWDFSRQVKAQGQAVWVTRRVPLSHIGMRHYANLKIWGTHQRDPGVGGQFKVNWGEA